jgi:3-oxoacyl-[acyl-carrier protein] reductase
MTQLFPSGAALMVGGSGGLGRAIVLELARSGSDIALTFLTNAAKADETAEEVRAIGREASCHLADVTQPAQLAAAFEAAAQRHGRIHTIVFAAGPIVEQAYVSLTAPDLWRRSLEIESMGFLNMFQASVARLREWGGGSYIHIGTAGQLAWPKRDGLSVAPKAFNEALIKGIAREEGRYGIRANSVLVGIVEGGMFLKLKERGEFGIEWQQQFLRTLPLPRLGKPEEIGYAATFLASNRAAYVTGQQINVSGGFGL